MVNIETYILHCLLYELRFKYMNNSKVLLLNGNAIYYKHVNLQSCFIDRGCNYFCYNYKQLKGKFRKLMFN